VAFRAASDEGVVVTGSFPEREMMVSVRMAASASVKVSFLPLETWTSDVLDVALVLDQVLE